jgi:hypothetical protein
MSSVSLPHSRERGNARTPASSPSGGSNIPGFRFAHWKFRHTAENGTPAMAEQRSRRRRSRRRLRGKAGMQALPPSRRQALLAVESGDSLPQEPRPRSLRRLQEPLMAQGEAIDRQSMGCIVPNRFRGRERIPACLEGLLTTLAVCHAPVAKSPCFSMYRSTMTLSQSFAR